MAKTILRLNHFCTPDDFKKVVAEWEAKDTDVMVIPYTMTLERGKAKWERVAVGVWRCSNCKATFPMMTDLNYCPRCGAEMEVGK